MNFKYFFLPFTLLAVLRPVSAHADTVGATATSTITLSPSADTVSLNAASMTFSITGSSTAFFEQDGVFTVGNSGAQVSDATYLWTDLITIDGITQSILISFDDDVEPTGDTLTINAADPVTFGQFTFALQGTTASGVAGDTPSIVLIGDINLVPTSAVPEPSSILLLSTGLLAATAAARRRRRLSLPRPA